MFPLSHLLSPMTLYVFCQLSLLPHVLGTLLKFVHTFERVKYRVVMTGIKLSEMNQGSKQKKNQRQEKHS